MAIKTLLTASVLGVIGAAVSTAAFADVNASTFCKPGFYAGVQGGRSDTFYHPESAMAQAIHDGTGTSTTTDRDSSGVITEVDTHTRYNSVSGADTDDVGIGGRIYAGYQFNPYFAVETGYTKYGKTDSHLRATNTGVNGSTPYSNGVAGSTSYSVDPNTYVTDYNGEITENAIDLVAKGTLPLQMGFGLYAKAGMAYIQADNHIDRTGVSSTYAGSVGVGATPTQTTTYPENHSTLYTKTYQAFRPVAGVGVNYTIPNTNMSLNADYTRVFSYGGIPNAKLASLGIEYKFA